MEVLLDVDIGVDDSITLLRALFNPGIEIVGISAVCGNVGAWLAAENTMKILDLVGASDIPIAAGAEKPSCREQDDRAVSMRGKSRLGNVELPPGRRSTGSMDVNRFHMDLAEQYEGELVVITLGPLTNIARTIREYPDFVHKVKGLVMIGGILTMCGNVSLVTKINMVHDPQTCDQVSTSGMDITVVGLDVTMRARLKMERLDWLLGCCKPVCCPAVGYTRQVIARYLRGNQIQNYCMGDCLLHDPLAVACAIMPSLVRTENREVRMECGGTYCRGMTMMDLREHPFQAEYVRFAMEVDSERAVRKLMSVFRE